MLGWVGGRRGWVGVGVVGGGGFYRYISNYYNAYISNMLYISRPHTIFQIIIMYTFQI